MMQCHRTTWYSCLASVAIPLMTEAERRLRERARAAGTAIDHFIARPVAHAATVPTPIEKLSGEGAHRFDASGDSETDLIAEIENAKVAMQSTRST